MFLKRWIFSYSSLPALDKLPFPWFQSGVMRPFVSERCIRTELISVFAIRGAYCPTQDSPSLIPVTQLYKVLANDFPPCLSFSSCSLHWPVLLLFVHFSFNRRSLWIFYITQDFRRRNQHSHQHNLQLLAHVWSTSLTFQFTSTFYSSFSLPRLPSFFSYQPPLITGEKSPCMDGEIHYLLLRPCTLPCLCARLICR